MLFTIHVRFPSRRGGSLGRDALHPHPTLSRPVISNQHDPSLADAALPLLVIGAGPKAVALAAKSRLLRKAGVDVPPVHVIERTAVAANWLPEGGWTDGHQLLGTSPEKDVGFPYVPAGLLPHADEINDDARTLSWSAYLVDRTQYAGWVDRGSPHPPHAEWADYLRWVARRIGMTVIRGAATRIGIDDAGTWAVDVDQGHADPTVLRGQGLVITGFGDGATRFSTPEGRVWDSATFWGREPEAIRGRHVAVIGGGETAGAIAVEIARRRAGRVTILSPGPTALSRGESHFESALFSEPAGWLDLTLEQRRAFITRTDRSVFSVRVQQTLAEYPAVTHRCGRVSTIDDVATGGVAITLQAPQGGEALLAADCVVDATGGDAAWFLPLLDASAADAIESALAGPLSGARIERSIGADLAVEDLSPKLFVPNLAALRQGPGFPNLSCLGLLADRVFGITDHSDVDVHAIDARLTGAPA